MSDVEDLREFNKIVGHSSKEESNRLLKSEQDWQHFKDDLLETHDILCVNVPKAFPALAIHVEITSKERTRMRHCPHDCGDVVFAYKEDAQILLEV